MGDGGGGHVGLGRCVCWVGVNSRHGTGVAVGGGVARWEHREVCGCLVCCNAPCHAHTFCTCVQHEG
jgi:hypothetical protein